MKRVSSKRMGTEPIIPLMFKLAFPAMIGMSIQALYNVVDSMYVGRISEESLSALSIAFPVQMVLIALGAGTGIGVTSFISRRLGAHKNKDATLAAENALFLGILYWIVVALVGYFFSDQIIMLFSDQAVLIQPASEYISIIMIGSIFIFFSMISNNIIRGEGNTFTPMIALIIGAVVNIVLDPFLIFGWWIFPEMGVRGAALATVIARAVSSVFLLYGLQAKTVDMNLSLKNFKINLPIIKEIYRVGLPGIFMQMIGSVTIALINIIAGNFHIYAIAVIGIFFRLQSFILMPVFGLGQGFMPIMGYNFGAGNINRMKNTLTLGMIISTVLTTIGFVLFTFFPAQLISLFNDNPEMIQIGQDILSRIGLSFPIIGISVIGSLTFQALGKGLNSFLISFLRQIGILLPVMYWLSKVTTFENIWYAFPLSEFSVAVIMYVWLYFFMKKTYATIEERNKITLGEMPIR
ncbi:MAG TPA: MATE family efflux transporter [Thermotogota bacterium]|nr:MATE family efflux transporter [Thermotogota bacterium]HRW34711.1 MATE family efflux transporter [Thermotogota bacterium]